MPSAIYEGIVRHRRYAPVEHRFTQPLFLLLIDLSELAGLYQQGIVAASGWGPAVVARGDFLGGGVEPLEVAVRRRVASELGYVPAGPIEMLAPLRQFGYFFSPLNLYYCWDAGHREVECILAEVSNTPWNERHFYLLHERNRLPARGTLAQHRHSKAFHVSPFMEMDYDYHWRVSQPAENLRVSIENRRDGHKRFDAALALHRQPLTRATLGRLLVRYPWMALQATLGIYFQALQLWIKQCPYVPHPASTTPAITPVSN